MSSPSGPAAHYHEAWESVSTICLYRARAQFIGKDLIPTLWSSMFIKCKPCLLPGPQFPHLNKEGMALDEPYGHFCFLILTVRLSPVGFPDLRWATVPNRAAHPDKSDYDLGLQLLIVLVFFSD